MSHSSSRLRRAAQMRQHALACEDRAESRRTRAKKLLDDAAALEARAKTLRFNADLIVVHEFGPNHPQSTREVERAKAAEFKVPSLLGPKKALLCK